MARSWSRAGLVVAFLFLLLTTGCSSRQIDGDATTYTYSWLVVIISFVGSGALAVAGGMVIAQERLMRNRAIGAVILLVGLLLLLGFAPRTFVTYVTVDANHVEGDQRALWFLGTAASSFNVRFDNLSGVEQRSEESIGRKGRLKEERFLVFVHRSGGETVVPMGSLLSAARPQIQQVVEARVAETGQDPHGSVAAVPEVEPVESIAQEPSRPADTRPRPAAANPAVKNEPSVVRATNDPAEKNESSAVRATNDPANYPVNAGTQPVSDETQLSDGTRVEIFWGSRWYPGKVLSLLPDGTVMVSYDGWSSSFNEAVPHSRLRLAADAPAAEAATPATVAAAEDLGADGDKGALETQQPQSPKAQLPPGPVTSKTQLSAGVRLEILWGSRWYPGEALDVLPDGRVKVHYDGWSSNFDEVVPRTRLRIPAGK